MVTLVLGKRRVFVGALGGCLIAVLSAPAISRTLLLRMDEARIVSRDVTLAASLVLPRWRQPPYPAVVVVHGSGRVTRDRLLNDARALGARGAAVLVYDKRGVGGSTGTYRPMAVKDSNERIGELADDVAAAVEYLAGRDTVDRARIGLIGGSEAGWVIPLAASRTNHVSFAIVLSGPAVSSGEEALFSELTGEDRHQDSPIADSEIDRRLASFTGPHGFDPRPILAAHRVPTLWILGARDRSIPPRQTQMVLRQVMADRNNVIDLRVLPTANHDLQDEPTGVPLPYWTLVTEWLRERGILR